MAEEIILEERTLEVLKNFAALNPGLVVEGGNVIRTITERIKTVSARVVVPQPFPVPFAIFDLKRFLGAVAMFSKPKITFDRGHVTVTEAEETETSGLEIVYPLTTPDCVDHPKKDPSIQPTFTFPVSKDHFKLFTKFEKGLELPNIILTAAGEGQKVYLGGADAAMPGKARVGGRMVVAESAPSAFRLVWAVEDWNKVMPDDYQVGIELRNGGAIAQFVGAGGDVNYWIPTRITDDRQFGARK
jgi:hypothetical protein